MPVTLVMFDIDGTLTESFNLDTATYLDALRETFGLLNVSEDWASYRYVTDSGILAEVFEARFRRPPSTDEASRFQTRYLRLLSERVADAGGILPVPGAVALLARLLASPDHAVAYASGGWRELAFFKLHSAGLPTGEVTGAFADDALSREEICRISYQRAESRCNRDFARVIYVGDGGWDVRASRHLGYDFVGIGRDAGAEKLRAEGAVRVLPDLREADKFLDLPAP